VAEPQYLRVVEQIAHLIDDGHYFRDGRGGKLPSLRDMRIEFDVGPTTLKMALAILEDRGVIRSKQGDGFYVTTDHRAKRGGYRRSPLPAETSGPSEDAAGAQPDDD
jgi:DNA-binding GntR family transcriptional regulator